eukprot:scaffold3484_cov69-Phaeocystis_antarctica.AAC.1
MTSAWGVRGLNPREVCKCLAIRAPSAGETSAERRMDDDESCGICYDRPRAVRNLPCGHGGICELCTIKSVQADGLIKCGICRCTVSKLAVVLVTPVVNPPLLTRMQTYQAEPETEGSVFESVDAFLQAKLGGDDAEVAEAATAALAR